MEVGGSTDTTGKHTDAPYRETWLPVELEWTSNRFVQHEALEHDEPLIDRSKRTLQYWVENAADAAAQQTGDTDYRRVSTHDLRLLQ